MHLLLLPLLLQFQLTLLLDGGDHLTVERVE